MASKTQVEDKIAVENGRLVVDVALTGGVPSKSGKSMVFFTTNGLTDMDDGYTIGINLIRKRGK
jgi:hypothetical protein